MTTPGASLRRRTCSARSAEVRDPDHGHVAPEGDPLRDRRPDAHAGEGPGTGGERDGVEVARTRTGGRQQRVDHLEHEGIVPPGCDTRVLAQARSVGKRYRARGAGGLDG